MDWITDQNIKDALGLTPADTYDDAWISGTTTAVNTLISTYRDDLDTTTGHDNVTRGALELAVKMYRSRGATDDGTGSLDMYAYAARYLDANVVMLLGLDRPVIA